MQLSDEDIAMIGDSLQHICRDLAADLFARPEQTCESKRFKEALNLFVDQGFVNPSPGDEGCGVWEGCEQAPQLALTLRNLSTIARVSASLALSVHRSALALHLLKRLSEPTELDATPCISLHGRHGIGRGELANWWCDQPYDEAVLRDVFAPDRDCLGLMPRQACSLVMPVFMDGAIGWQIMSGSVQGSAPGHGLDELHDGAFAARQTRLVQLPVQQAKALSRDIWHREWLGLLAIQQGCVQQMSEMAQAFSTLRFQGGRIIAGHAAVQIMKADMQAALTDVRTVLAGQTLSEAGFVDLLRARNRLHEGLALAANVAMQTFGGLGYMRDNGIEKRWRDVNHLRQQSGSASDVQLMSANWRDLEGAAA